MPTITCAVSLSSRRAPEAEEPWGRLTLSSPPSAPILTFELNGAGVALGRDGQEAADTFCRERGYEYINLDEIGSRSAALDAAVARVHGLHALIVREAPVGVRSGAKAGVRNNLERHGPWLMRDATCSNGVWIGKKLVHAGRPVQLTDSDVIILVNQLKPERHVRCREHSSRLSYAGARRVSYGSVICTRTDSEAVVWSRDRHGDGGGWRVDGCVLCCMEAISRGGARRQRAVGGGYMRSRPGALRTIPNRLL